VDVSSCGGIADAEQHVSPFWIGVHWLWHKRRKCLYVRFSEVLRPFTQFVKWSIGRQGTGIYDHLVDLTLHPVPSVIILSGWILAALMVRAGLKLKRRQSYTFCFVVAAIECALMPMGTILGVFTLLLLYKPEVKELFRPSPPLPALGS